MRTPALTRHRARYLVPLGAAAITAIVVVGPQAASGAQHPKLPVRTAAQLLAQLESAQLPQFSGTTVETARLGLPSIDTNNLPAGVAAPAQSQLAQLVTLLTGSHTAQIAYGGPERQRVAIFLSDLSETDVVHNGTDLWTYTSTSNSVTHNTLKQHDDTKQTPEATTPVDPTKAARQALKNIDPSTKVTVDRTAQVAGRPAYQLDLDPRDSRTLISSVRIALDSKTSMPLRVQIWSRNHTGQPAFSVGFTSLSLKAPSAATFDFTKPPSATMQADPFARPHHASPASHPGSKRASSTTIGKDWTTVFEASLPDDSTSTAVPAPAPSGPPPAIKGQQPVRRAPSLNQTLDQFATQVPDGHLIATNLISVLITNDNRVLLGAVTPQYLQQVAASKAAQ